MKKREHAPGSHRFRSTLERSDNKLWGCHFQVPHKVAEDLRGDKTRRVVCSLNDSASYQCAMLHHGKGTYVISVNKRLRTELRLDFGSTVEVELTKDESTYGLQLPEEFSELFRQDAEGKKLFHALTSGKQRTLLYIVGSVKDPDKRLHRALTILRHIKHNRGTLNYRQLAVLLKDPRRRKPRP